MILCQSIVLSVHTHKSVLNCGMITLILYPWKSLDAITNITRPFYLVICTESFHTKNIEEIFLTEVCLRDSRRYTYWFAWKYLSDKSGSTHDMSRELVLLTENSRLIYLCLKLILRSERLQIIFKLDIINQKVLGRWFTRIW